MESGTYTMPSFPFAAVRATVALLAIDLALVLMLAAAKCLPEFHPARIFLEGRIAVLRFTLKGAVRERGEKLVWVLLAALLLLLFWSATVGMLDAVAYGPDDAVTDLIGRLRR